MARSVKVWPRRRSAGQLRPRTGPSKKRLLSLIELHLRGIRDTSAAAVLLVAFHTDADRESARRITGNVDWICDPAQGRNKGSQDLGPAGEAHLERFPVVADDRQELRRARRRLVAHATDSFPRGHGPGAGQHKLEVAAT